MTLIPLPPEPPARFAGARRSILRCPDGELEVVVADRLLLRLRGLAGLRADELVPLAIPSCRSIHTVGMRAAIDVVWLAIDRNRVSGAVLEVRHSLPPARLACVRPRGPGRIGALELPAGMAAECGLEAAAEVSMLSEYDF